MKRFAAFIVLIVGIGTTTQAVARNRAVMKTGWMFIIQPELHYLFDAQFTGRYQFAGPFAFEYGGGFGINLNTFTSDILLGGVLSFRRGHWVPYFRSAFLIKWIEVFDDDVAKKKNIIDRSYLVLAATMSPGFSYRFKNGRSIGFDVAFEVGEKVSPTKHKHLYWGVLPGLIFVF